MNHYLIEFRFFGKSKYEVNDLIEEINNRYHIFPRHRPVPHATLVGPFSTNNPQRLVSDFKRICDKYDPMKFSVDGYGTFADTRVVYVNIKPDSNLQSFRRELSKTLSPYCQLRAYDHDHDYQFHATLAMKIPPDKFARVVEFTKKAPHLKYTHYLLRATIIHDHIILCEYDFMLKRLHDRGHAKNPLVLRKTFEVLKSKFRCGETNNSHFDTDSLQPPVVCEEGQPPKCPSIDLGGVGLFAKIGRLFKRGRIFLISDPHFDHGNIIKYCNRPFSSVYQMNKTLISNWNKTVGEHDTVILLGDLAYGRNSRKIEYWLEKLNGDIIFIKGNHDVPSAGIKEYDSLKVRYRGITFLLVHDPADIPTEWKGWVICGHHHNHKLSEYPLINGKKKTINVGVELIKYTPLDFDRLFSLGFEKIDHMKDIDSEPVISK